MTDQQYPSGKRIREMREVVNDDEFRSKLTNVNPLTGGVVGSENLIQLASRVDALEHSVHENKVENDVRYEIVKDQIDSHDAEIGTILTRLTALERMASLQEMQRTIDELDQLKAENSELEAHNQRVRRDHDHYRYLNEQLRAEVEGFKIEVARLTVNLADSQSVASFYAAKVDSLERRSAEYVEQIEKLKAAGNE